MDVDKAFFEMTDEELAKNAQAGSRLSFEELVSRYSSRLYNFLRIKIISAQETEDLVQDTFLKAYKNIHRYDPEWKFSTWLYTMANRLAISFYRTNRVKPFQKDIKIPEEPGPEDITIKKETSRNIWLMARNLKHDQYRALWLHYGEDMPVKEIAEIMQKSQINVRVLLHRARIILSKKVNSAANPASAAHTMSVSVRQKIEML